MGTSTDTTQSDVIPVHDEDACPLCARDFATCRCYYEGDDYEDTNVEDSYGR